MVTAQTESLTINEVSFNLRELVQSAAQSFRHQTAIKELNFTVDVSDNVPEEIKSDPVRLK